MVKRKTLQEFRETGLLLFINQLLHIFGWVIIIELDADGNQIEMYPARTKSRGFSQADVTKAYIKLSKYMKQNAEELEKDAID